MAGPTLDFWQRRFESGQMPWDRGDPHPQLAHWLDQRLITPAHRVLVPGCGSGHELLALARAGVPALGLDYAPAAVAIARQRLADSSAVVAAVEQADVLNWQPEAPVQRIYEQTCLCALHPDHWVRYAQQLHDWLAPNGLLLALFMQARRDSADEGLVEGPPYHCDVNAMRALFPVDRWEWPAPPYAGVAHAQGWQELPVVLRRR